MYAAKDDPEKVAEPSSAFHSVTHNQVFGVEVQKYDVRTGLGEVKMPTLVTIRRHDKICPVSCSEEIAQGIKGARLKNFEESRHSPLTEESKAFQTYVREFAVDLSQYLAL